MMITITWKQWVQAFCVGLIGLTCIAFSAHAEDITADATISDVSFTSTSTTPSEPTTLTISFTIAEELAEPERIYFQIEPTDCQEDDSDNCRYDFSSLTDGDLTFSGPGSLTVDQASEEGNFEVQLSENLSAGAYTLSFNAVNPAAEAAQRILALTSTFDGCEAETRCGTEDEDAVAIGTVLVTGTITNGEGIAIQTHGQAHDESWSQQVHFNSGPYGKYWIFGGGFSSIQEMYITIYPDPEETGASTHTEIVSLTGGTPVVHNFSPPVANKHIVGSVTYESTGDPVTAVSLYVNNETGDHTGGDVDANGEFDISVSSAGPHEVCLSDHHELQTDWYTDNWEARCNTVQFTDDDSEESETVNFKVKIADAMIVGTVSPTPSEGGWISFSADDHWFGGNVSDTDGTFSVAVVGGDTTISATTLFATAVSSTEYTVSYEGYGDDDNYYLKADPVTVSAGETVDVGTLALTEKDVTLTITATDGAKPISGMDVNAWQHNGGWTNEQTDDSGVAVLKLYEGTWWVEPSTHDMTQYTNEEGAYEVSVVSGDTGTHTFTLTATTLSVNISLQDSEGALLNTLHGWAGCWEPESHHGGIGGSIDNGVATFGAVAGDYTCNVWVSENSPYQSTGDQNVTFVDGEDATLPFTMVERTSTLVANVKTTDNELVTDSDMYVFAAGTTGSWSDEIIGDDGQATLLLAPGTYHVGVHNPHKGGGGLTDYIPLTQWNSDLQLLDGEAVNTTVTVERVNATVTATLTDPDGNPVDWAHVGCGNWQEMEGVVLADTEGARVIENWAQTGSDGVAVVGLVTGHEYECWAGASSDSGFLSPESQQAKLLNKANIDLTFPFREADATIEGTVNAPGDAEDSISDLWCNAWSESGAHSHSGSHNKEFSLNAIKGDTWGIWCDGFTTAEDGTRTWYHSEEDEKVELKKAGASTGHEVKLVESWWNAYEGGSYTGDGTQATTIILPDGAELYIPANAIVSSGNETITYDPVFHAYHSFQDSPFGVPWNFEAYDANNVLVSGDFNSAVTLTIPYREEDLTKMGINEDNVLPKIYNPESGTWETVDKVAQNEEANTITFTLSHFSQVGLVYNKQRVGTDYSPAKKVKKLKVKKKLRKKKRVTVTWKRHKYRTILKIQKWNKKKKKYKKFRTIRVKKNKKNRIVRKLKAGTKYRVKARKRRTVDGEYYFSNWTKWVKFKTAE